MKRFSILIAILCASTFAMAQKADAAFVVGGSFVSDTNETFLASAIPGGLPRTIKTDHHIFLEGALGVRLLNAHAASLHVGTAGCRHPVTDADASQRGHRERWTIFHVCSSRRDYGSNCCPSRRSRPG